MIRNFTCLNLLSTTWTVLGISQEIREEKRQSSAIKDEHGNLLTNKELVERIVLEQLALIFSGKISSVFTHRNEQLIKEAQAKSNNSWQDWIIPENDETMYEPEICVPVNESLGLEHLDNLRNNHAPGVDNITTSMLKRAGAEALTCLTSLVNNNLHENQAPEVLNTGKMTLIDKKLVTFNRCFPETSRDGQLNPEPSHQDNSFFHGQNL